MRVLLVSLLAWLALLPAARAQDAAVAAVPTASFPVIVSAHLPENSWQVYQWNAEPNVYVVQFETYLLQGQAFNRVAAYIEKYGQRGRIPTWRQLSIYLREQRLSMENLYSAHDYRTSDLARFYNGLSAVGDKPTDAELGVRDTLAEIGLIAWNEGQGRWEAAGEQAVLSIATRYLGNEQPASRVMGRRDRHFEAIALYHETRHGFYFTEPEYARICTTYWKNVLGERDRQLFRLVLKSMDYDPGDEELMINEWQAYLLTPTHEFVGVGAVTSALRELAEGKRRPANLSSAERGQFVGRGPALAIDVERWMVDDLRLQLGERYDFPPVQDVEDFYMSGV